MAALSVGQSAQEIYRELGAEARAPVKVLVVEDNPADARLVFEMLRDARGMRFEVESVARLSEAVERLRSSSPNILLLDLGLPDAAGLEGLQKLRTVAEEIPAIVLSGFQDDQLMARAVEMGAQDYLVKGTFDTEGLERTIRYAMQRKHAEVELGVARNRLSHLLSENPAVIYALHIEGPADLGLASCSENLERLLGYSVEDALARGWWSSHLHPDEREQVLADMAGLFAYGRLIQEYRFLHRDGAYVWLRDEKRVVRDAAGQPTEVVGTLSDVTERKSAEWKLLESERRFSSMLGNLRLVSLMLDNEGRITYCNDYLLRLTGWEQPDVFGRSWFELFVPPDDTGMRGRFAALLADDPAAWHQESAILTRAGGRKLIRWNNSILRSSTGEVIGTASIGEDITDQKGMEEALRQSQKMEAIGRLAGGIAHDFNNLLGVITGYSELLGKSLGPGHPGAGRVEQIRKAAGRAADLTRQLLAFSRKQVLQPRVLDLNEVVADVEKMLRRVIGEHVQLVTSPTAGLGRIRADPGQIEQILMNLVVNGRDAMPRGGELVVGTRNVALDDVYAGAHPEVAPGPFVMLSVTDTGEGMDAETQVQIFEPFFTTKEQGKGTGLGLATVFGIVQQSGGSISVDSRLGAGTTFRICFPRVEEELSRPSASPKVAPPGGAETVLVVEDADSLRGMIREILEDAGYAVVESAGAEDALLKVSALGAPVHLMLTDVVMPRMSGPDLARRVRLVRPEIKVLFMSGYTDEAMGLHGILAADTGFIQKPFAAADLLQKVREGLDEIVPDVRRETRGL